MKSKPKKAPARSSAPMDFSLLNRGYNARMRDVYFQKGAAQLATMAKKQDGEPFAPDTVQLNKLVSAINTCREFAQQAARGVRNSNSMPKSSEGGPGFFKEEILFIHILDELHSSCLFLRSRFNTLHELNLYRNKINGLLKAGGREGYLTKILHFIREKQAADETESQLSLGLLQDRMALCKRIFEIIKTRKGG